MAIYTNRKDGGKFQAPSYNVQLTKYQLCLTAPIAYDQAIAELAAEKRLPYRTVFLARVMKENGFDEVEFIKKRTQVAE